MKKINHFIKKLSLGLMTCALAFSGMGPLTSVGAQEFTPGTYSGSGQGFGGEIKVEVSLSQDRIVAIEVEEDETQGIGDTAIADLTQQVIEGQTLNLDTISGATYTSEGFLMALAAALESSGADVEALKNKEADEPLGNQIEETNADVIVIGGGGAGLAAAVSAHQNGASVILVEKMPRLGGNTIISGAAYNAADPGRQEALEMTDLERQTVEDILAADYEDELVQSWKETLQAEWDEYNESGATYLFDSPSLHKFQTYIGGDMEANPELVDILGENAYTAIEWLEELGMEFTDHIFTVLGALWNRSHKPAEPLGTGYINTLQAYMDENAGEMNYYLNTTATDLVVDDQGRVTGVVVNHLGEEVELSANKAVIIATGGFGANNEMVQEYNTNWASLEGILTTNHVGATGDGIGLGLHADASLVGMEDIQLLPMGDPETGSLSGNIEQGVQDRIFVNKDGLRFVDEGERRDVMSQALLEQTDSFMWTIVDAHSYPTGDTLNNFNESIDELVAAGRAYKGDTLEELAEAIGVPVDAFVATVEEFNQAVAGEIEDPFGRTLFDNPIDTAPFYAAGRMPTIHHTMGGLQINEAAQVLNEQGEVIEGLFAAGEVTGGIHGTNRLGGNALADIIVYGRIAGNNAAKSPALAE